MDGTDETLAKPMRKINQDQKAWLRGVADGERGYEFCPYPLGTRKASSWWAGYGAHELNKFP